MYMKNKQATIGVLVGIVLVFVCSSLVVEKRLSDTRVASKVAVSEQLLKLTQLSKDIGDGKAIELARTSSVINDCQAEEGQRYDELLSSLDKGLGQAELEALEQLFNQCGSIPAASRAFVVYMLEQEVATLTLLVGQQELLGDSSFDTTTLGTWQELVVKEKEIKTQFYALVALQGQIINTLQTENGADIAAIQKEVQLVQQKYAAAIAEASELRSTLVAS